MAIVGKKIYLGNDEVTLINNDGFVFSNPYYVSSLDADAAAFIDAAGISGSNATAIEGLVSDLKDAGLWAKLDVVYPMIGASYSTMKWNLKNPIDSDAAFRFSEGGSPTYSAADGVLTNGTNSYINTHYNLSTDATFNDTHMSIWEENCIAWSGTTIPYGAFNETTGVGIFLTPKIASAGLARVRMYVNAADEAFNEGSGFWLGTNNGTTTSFYKNGGLEASVGETNSGTTLPNSDVWAGGLNSTNYPGNFRYGAPLKLRWLSLGLHLDSTEQSDLYTAVSTYQTAIGR